jgi:hypothetical protein
MSYAIRRVLDFRNSRLLKSVLNSRELNFLPTDQLENIGSVLRIIGPGGLGENQDERAGWVKAPARRAFGSEDWLQLLESAASRRDCPVRLSGRVGRLDAVLVLGTTTLPG